MADYHKNGRRKLKNDQLDETQKKKRKTVGYVTNRLSEVIYFFMFHFFYKLQKREQRSKGALSMVDNPAYQEWLEDFGLDDVNEILSKNDYQSLEESDPDNDPSSSIEHKKIFIYNLP